MSSDYKNLVHWLSTCVIATWIAVLVAACAWATEDIDRATQETIALNADDSEREKKVEQTERAYTIEFNGHTLRVPAGYLWPEDRFDRRTEVFSLLMLWPGLEPESQMNAKEFRVPGGGRQLGGVIHASAIRLSIAEVLRSKRSSFDYVEGGYQHGLALLSKRQASNGRHSSSSLDNDLLVRQEGGQALTVISCTRSEIPDPAPEAITGRVLVHVPRCSHEFILEDIHAIARFSYRRIYLSEWQRIEKSITDLVRSFVVN